MIDPKEINKIFHEVETTLIKKNNDYGSKIDNISLTGLQGISIRLLDKAARLYSINSGVKQKVTDESTRDTLVDMIGYAVIGLLLKDGKWNKPTL